MKVYNDVWNFKEKSIHFLGNGPRIYVKLQTERDLFKMAAQISWHSKKFFFSIHHKSYTLFFSFWKFKLSSKKAKENVAGSNSDL